MYIKRIFEREQPPSLVTWGLWFLLDVVAMSAELYREVFNVQLVTYTIGTLLVCIALLMRRNLSWDRVWDSITMAIVVLSAVLFLTLEDQLWSLITALAGMTIAAFPLLRDLTQESKKPWTEPWNAWLIIAIGSGINYLDGKVLSSVWLGLLQIGILVIVVYWHIKRRLAFAEEAV